MLPGLANLEQDKKWLAAQYPGLTLSKKSVSGVLDFEATYDKTNNIFYLYGNLGEVGGLKLSGSFKVRIEERPDKRTSKLPALFVDGIETIQDRHFNQSDYSACLCSPLDEAKFLEQNSIKPFLEELVIPFLYGQVYYTKYGEWPWAEYAHGGLGLLEAYLDFHKAENERQNLLNLLKQDQTWPKYEKLLKSVRPSKQLCPCGSGYLFRDCHPKALLGFIQLKKELNQI